MGDEDKISVGSLIHSFIYSTTKCQESFLFHRLISEWMLKAQFFTFSLSHI